VVEEVGTRTPAQMRELIIERLRASVPNTDPQRTRVAGMTQEQFEASRRLWPQSPTAAAVLVPIVEREDARAFVDEHDADRDQRVGRADRQAGDERRKQCRLRVVG